MKTSLVTSQSTLSLLVRFNIREYITYPMAKPNPPDALCWSKKVFS